MKIEKLNIRLDYPLNKIGVGTLQMDSNNNYLTIKLHTTQILHLYNLTSRLISVFFPIPANSIFQMLSLCVYKTDV